MKNFAHYLKAEIADLESELRASVTYRRIAEAKRLLALYEDDVSADTGAGEGTEAPAPTSEGQDEEADEEAASPRSPADKDPPGDMRQAATPVTPLDVAPATGAATALPAAEVPPETAPLQLDPRVAAADSSTVPAASEKTDAGATTVEADPQGVSDAEDRPDADPDAEKAGTEEAMPESEAADAATPRPSMSRFRW